LNADYSQTILKVKTTVTLPCVPLWPRTSDGFTHRSWSRAPRFWGPAQFLPLTTHY